MPLKCHHMIYTNKLEMLYSLIFSIILKVVFHLNLPISSFMIQWDKVAHPRVVLVRR